MWYGSIDNRLDENKMYCDKIEVGTGMTSYGWSDCHAYEVVKVEDQKHIWVRRYGRRKADNIPQSNNWELFSDETQNVIELKYRYNHWYVVNRDKITGLVKYYRKNVSFGIAEECFDYSF